MTDQQTNLRTLARIITTHNPQGKSVISTHLPSQVPKTSVQDGAAYHASPYSTEQFPVDMNNDKDLDNYARYLTSSASGLVNPTGTVVHIAEFAPGFLSAMHRTVSLDLVVVLEGEIELVLDSGETKRLGPGDQCVQRGTMHAWRNCSGEVWARMICVVQPARELVVGGERLGEEMGGMGEEFGGAESN
ncbi:hypothetical protein LTS10_002786 [Elasticomyces elasticus]|nr:hypothetical protein LTS10_002786 [Elasticomyces elasticus]